MNAAELTAEIHRQNVLINRLGAELESFVMTRAQVRGELAKLKWGGLTKGCIVRMPKGTRFVVTIIRLSDGIERGEKPWVFGVQINRDGRKSKRRYRCCFDDWTVE
jgi:hypothetical protein